MLRYPAAERNREAILQVIKQYIKNGALVLEVASGSGQHTAHFAQHLPHATFQPTDISADCLKSIDAHTANEQLTNIKSAKFFDVSNTSSYNNLGLNQIDVLYCANMIHISSDAAVDGLFTVAGKMLKQDGLLITYGPYSIDGVISPQSNVEFDKSLRQRNPEWGYRDTRFLNQLANKNGLKLVTKYEMPANNYTLIFERNL